MIFDEEKTAVWRRLEFRHVALFRAQARDSANAILEAGARLQLPAVGRHRRLLPRLDQALQGREDQFRPPTLSVRRRFREASFAGT